MLNQTVEYALRAVIYVAHDPAARFRAAEIASGINAPRTYVAKILGQLVRTSCGAHRQWAPIAKTLDCFFANTTIADLLSPAHLT